MKVSRKAAVFLILIVSCGCAVMMEAKAPEVTGKVTICHKGKKTSSVDEAAVKAHLGHGDSLGACR